jgi:hypothetical protein
VAQYVNVLHAHHRLRRDLGIRRTGIAELLLPVGLASAATSLVLFAGTRLLGLGPDRHRWYLLIGSAVLGLVGAAVFAAVAGALHLPDIRRLRADASVPVDEGDGDQDDRDP